MAFFLLLVFLCPVYAADVLQIYSEFRRVDANGKLLAADSDGKPREILSPASFAAVITLRIVVRPVKNAHYALLPAQNPENSVQMKLYRELPQAPTSKIADKLEPAKTPVEWEGTGVQVFWLDLFTPADAKVQRVRIEAQVHDGDGWIIYPMEVRILSGIVPKVRPQGMQLPPLRAASDTPVRLALREYMCEEKLKPGAPAATARSFVYRNAQQDIALARTLQVKWTRERLIEGMAKAAGAEDVAKFCAVPETGFRKNSPLGPEWYLKVRDFLYREASH